MSKTPQDIIDLFREKLGHDEAGFEPKYWEQFEKVLDKEERKRPSMFRFPLLVLTVLAVCAMPWKDMNRYKAAGEPAADNKTNTGITAHAAPHSQVAQAQQAAEGAALANEANAINSKTEATGHETAEAVPAGNSIAAKTGASDMHSSAAARMADNDVKKSYAHNRATTSAEGRSAIHSRGKHIHGISPLAETGTAPASSQKNFLANSRKRRNTTAMADRIGSTQKASASGTENGNKSEQLKDAGADHNTASVTEAPEKEKIARMALFPQLVPYNSAGAGKVRPLAEGNYNKENHHVRRLELGVMLGELTYGSLSNLQPASSTTNLTLAAGIYAGYHFRPHWAVTAEPFIADKAGNDLVQTAKTTTHYTMPRTTYANYDIKMLRTIQAPVMLSYTLKHHSFSAGGYIGYLLDTRADVIETITQPMGRFYSNIGYANPTPDEEATTVESNTNGYRRGLNTITYGAAFGYQYQLSRLSIKVRYMLPLNQVASPDYFTGLGSVASYAGKYSGASKTSSGQLELMFGFRIF